MQPCSLCIVWSNGTKLCNSHYILVIYWSVHTPTFLFTAVCGLPTTMSLLLKTASNSSLGSSPMSYLNSKYLLPKSQHHIQYIRPTRNHCVYIHMCGCVLVWGRGTCLCQPNMYSCIVLNPCLQVYCHSLI